MAIHIKGVIDKFLEKKKQDFKQQDKVQQVVARFLGEKTQDNIYLKRIFKGVFVFGAASSSFAYDFELKKIKILEGIRKEFSQVKDIKIEIG